MAIHDHALVRYPLFDVLRPLLACEVVRFHDVNVVPGTTRQIVLTVPGFLAHSGFLILQIYERSGSWGRVLDETRPQGSCPPLAILVGEATDRGRRNRWSGRRDSNSQP